MSKLALASGHALFAYISEKHGFTLNKWEHHLPQANKNQQFPIQNGKLLALFSRIFLLGFKDRSPIWTEIAEFGTTRDF
ncbi:hypothetical protein [Lacticaseibacillus paracasei]|uniref:hypothetical protein n=1 Tax=Lacticaseibacillus paracasei TaxID=1597 RepID=UPI00115A9B0C|nr:hypothetical protein [Lacticaseibacillus paracasei]MCP9309043.1 hypothetical protein [Lacticaseibacillus paracasei]